MRSKAGPGEIKLFRIHQLNVSLTHAGFLLECVVCVGLIQQAVGAVVEVVFLAEGPFAAIRHVGDRIARLLSQPTQHERRATTRDLVLDYQLVLGADSTELRRWLPRIATHPELIHSDTHLRQSLPKVSSR